MCSNENLLYKIKDSVNLFFHPTLYFLLQATSFRNFRKMTPDNYDISFLVSLVNLSLSASLSVLPNSLLYSHSMIHRLYPWSLTVFPKRTTNYSVTQRRMTNDALELAIEGVPPRWFDRDRAIWNARTSISAGQRRSPTHDHVTVCRIFSREPNGNQADVARSMIHRSTPRSPTSNLRYRTLLGVHFAMLASLNRCPMAVQCSRWYFTLGGKMV